MNERDKEKNGRMNTNSTDQLTKALAGAVAIFRPNRTDGPVYREDMSNAYLKLKEMIQEEYPQMDVDLLDIGPGSAERQQLIALQLQDAGVLLNEKILYQARLHIGEQTVILNKGDSWVVPQGAEHIYEILETFTAVEATHPPCSCGRTGSTINTVKNKCPDTIL